MWQEADGKLNRRFEFTDFAQALEFVNKVGKLAEAANHHPDISFGWGYAEVTLTTHKEGGITDKDRKLAKQIDKIKLILAGPDRIVAEVPYILPLSML